jgi:hypothetical protein
VDRAHTLQGLAPEQACSGRSFSLPDTQIGSAVRHILSKNDPQHPRIIRAGILIIVGIHGRKRRAIGSSLPTSEKLHGRILIRIAGSEDTAWTFAPT